jgi:serine/threonine protein kinase
MSQLIHQRYLLLKKCGSGGTGVVYEAQDLRLKRLVAIKRVEARVDGRRDLLVRLLKEAENLARIEHPNVVTVHDILETPTSVSIVMELVKGKPFLTLFSKRAIPEAEFLRYFRQLLAALEAVHGVGMIHRDVNPRNVMVSKEGVVKLTDFGLSGSVNDGNLRAGGTLGYMPPETLRKGGVLSYGVDIYGLGFLAFQALLGLPAFKRLYGAARPRDWLRWILSREPFKTLEELEAPVTPGLSRVIAKMLEKEVEKRYRKVAEVRRDLDTTHHGAAGGELEAAQGT